MQQAVSLRITDTSVYTICRMKNHPVFQVHSVYRKTINLHAEGNLIAIQAINSPLSPVSLITNLTQSQMEQLPVFVGQFVYITDTHLIFCKDSQNPVPIFAFCYDGASVHNLALSRLFYFPSDHQLMCHDRDLIMSEVNALSSTIPKLKLLIHGMITRAHTNGIDLVYSESPDLKENMIMSAAKARIDAVSQLLSKEAWSEASSELIRLLGLGIGLTPSGDDFTTGVLAGLILFNLTDHPFSPLYREQVLLHRFDTNDVSRTFLTAALDGQFSTAINTLANIKKEDLGENISQTGDILLEKFLAIGHSSGIDALCGIYFVLCNFMAS